MLSKLVARMVLLGALVAIVLIYPLLAPTPHRIDQAHFELIEEGMTLGDVEAIFGVPAGDYDSARPDTHIYALRLKVALALQQARLSEVTLVQKLPQHELDVRLEPVEPATALIIRSPPEIKRWVGRHGAFRVSFDQEGRVVGTRSLGATHIEYPWKRWWQKLTAK